MFTMLNIAVKNYTKEEKWKPLCLELFLCMLILNVNILCHLRNKRKCQQWCVLILLNHYHIYYFLN